MCKIKKLYCFFHQYSPKKKYFFIFCIVIDYMLVFEESIGFDLSFTNSISLAVLIFQYLNIITYDTNLFIQSKLPIFLKKTPVSLTPNIKIFAFTITDFFATIVCGPPTSIKVCESKVCIFISTSAFFTQFFPTNGNKQLIYI